MTERPKMNSVRVCPKCADGSQNDPITAGRRPCTYRGVGLTMTGNYSDEYLARTCTRCQYVWEESCVDA